MKTRKENKTLNGEGSTGSGLNNEGQRIVPQRQRVSIIPFFYENGGYRYEIIDNHTGTILAGPDDNGFDSEESASSFAIRNGLVVDKPGVVDLISSRLNYALTAISYAETLSCVDSFGLMELQGDLKVSLPDGSTMTLDDEHRYICECYQMLNLYACGYVADEPCDIRNFEEILAEFRKHCGLKDYTE